AGDGTGGKGGVAPAPEATKKPDLVWKPKTDGGPGVPGTSGASGVSGTSGASGPDEKAGADEGPEPKGDGAGPEKPVLGSSIVFAPGVRPAGPRDYSPAEPEEGADGSDEGHFVPPEPPPLPEADATAKFAWLGVVGGPVLLLVAVLLQWDMTWWLTTLCVGGFLGGFATLVARMQHDDDDDGFDDPGRGAVV
ncbi:hypothetical protein ACFQ7A_32160, partial [Streptomyces sp. NPDC056528]|uniref:hypothetical protein n=1 Tax=Streptomyces sp. NPDC056528 TaxID=3345854 RepID=UPI00367F2DC9